MTDAEIRAELARQVEQDGRSIAMTPDEMRRVNLAEKINAEERSIVVDPACGPPLMLVCQHWLTEQGRQNIRESMALAWAEGKPKPIVVEGGMEVFQLIGGEWTKL